MGVRFSSVQIVLAAGFSFSSSAFLPRVNAPVMSRQTQGDAPFDQLSETHIGDWLVSDEAYFVFDADDFDER